MSIIFSQEEFQSSKQTSRHYINKYSHTDDSLNVKNDIINTAFKEPDNFIKQTQQQFLTEDINQKISKTSNTKNNQSQKTNNNQQNEQQTSINNQQQPKQSIKKETKINLDGLKNLSENNICNSYEEEKKQIIFTLKAINDELIQKVIPDNDQKIEKSKNKTEQTELIVNQQKDQVSNNLNTIVESQKNNLSKDNSLDNINKEKEQINLNLKEIKTWSDSKKQNINQSTERSELIINKDTNKLNNLKKVVENQKKIIKKQITIIEYQNSKFDHTVNKKNNEIHELKLNLILANNNLKDMGNNFKNTNAPEIIKQKDKEIQNNILKINKLQANLNNINNKIKNHKCNKKKEMEDQMFYLNETIKQKELDNQNYILKITKLQADLECANNKTKNYEQLKSKYDKMKAILGCSQHKITSLENDKQQLTAQVHQQNKQIWFLQSQINKNQQLYL